VPEKSDMRIFYACHSPATGIRGSKIWYYNLYLPLVDLGHDVVSCDYDWLPLINCADPSHPGNSEYVKENRPLASEELVRQVRLAHHAKPIDLFFSYFYSSCVDPEAIKEIRKLGIVTVNWYCNASYQFHLVKEIAPSYDYCLVPEKFRLKDYRRIGANPVYCQEAANPHIYKPYQIPRQFDVVFVGRNYGNRPNYIRYLLDKEIDVRVWGPDWQNSDQRPQPPASPSAVKRLVNLRTRQGWRNAWGKVQRAVGLLPPIEAPVSLPSEICGPPLEDEEMIKMYSSSKISLGFSSCGDTHLKKRKILQVRLRDFEAPMSGAFYMVEYMQELEEFFEIGKEIVCYHDEDDLADKIRYFLAHEKEREEIRQAGYQRALNKHTWHKRFEEVFNQMGLPS